MTVDKNFEAVLKSFSKDVAKMKGVSTDDRPPRYWYDSGNYVLNYIMSGSMYHAVPQGRLTCLAGPSSSGKSFIQCNITANAQKDGETFVVMIDSENALDKEFTSKIGVNTDPSQYMYISAITIKHVTDLISTFIKSYRANNKDNLEAGRRVLIVIDSLDMLMTESEFDAFQKGDNKGDQGQRAKQYKALLRYLVQEIKDLNIAVVVTHQVYKASADQLLAGEGTWVVNGAVRYSLSQIMLITRLKLKGEAGNITGVRMKCEGFKTRFTKPFQTVTVEVPYDTGCDRWSGFTDMAQQIGVLERRGSYLRIVGTEIQFYAKNVEDYAEELLGRCEHVLKSVTMKAVVEEDDEDDSE